MFRLARRGVNVSNARMGIERRKQERTEVKVRFSARDESGAGTLSFTSGDVSTGGAFLNSELLLEQGEALSLDFELPGNTAVHAQARVAWVRRFPETGQQAGMGVEFVSLSDDERAALSRWLTP